jgi:hypothetical protein
MAHFNQLFHQHLDQPADDLETFVKNAAALNAPNDRIWGTALRGVAGASPVDEATLRRVLREELKVG